MKLNHFWCVTVKSGMNLTEAQAIVVRAFFYFQDKNMLGDIDDK